MFTQDRSTRESDYRPIFVSGDVSENMSTTPEGYLLCRNVPIARTGEYLYNESDFNNLLQGDSNGHIRVLRTADEVFSPQSLASFEGKPVTIGHHSEFISPENWQKVTVGSARNVRAGEGSDSDKVVADLLITTQDGIEYIKSGIRDVSCGYDAEYDQTEPGSAHQRSIMGNHIAIVATGRGGVACSIKDEDTTMNPWQRLLATFGAKNGEELQAKLQTTDSGTLTEEQQLRAECDRLKDTNRRLRAKVRTKDSVPTKVKIDAATVDSVVKAASLRRHRRRASKAKTRTTDAATVKLVPQAEILVPGAKAAVGESPARFKRRILTEAMTTDAASAVETFTGGSDIGKMGSAEIDAAFRGAATMKKHMNNSGSIATGGVQTKDSKRPVTPADINEANRKHFGK